MAGHRSLRSSRRDGCASGHWIPEERSGWKSRARCTLCLNQDKRARLGESRSNYSWNQKEWKNEKVSSGVAHLLHSVERKELLDGKACAYELGCI